MKHLFGPSRAKKTSAAAALAALISLAALSACSGSGGSEGSGDVTLTYAMWDEASRPAEEKVVAAFEKANPDISVTIQLTPWDQYWQKMQAATTGGTTADVVWMEPRNYPLYASNGVLAPLSEKIASSNLDQSDYAAPIVDSLQWDGEQYALPRDDSMIGLWYNKKLFDRAGVSYPTADWTWDDMKSAAAKLTDPSTGVYGIAAMPFPQFTYYNTIMQAGGQILSDDGTSAAIDSPEGAEGLRFWRDLIAAGHSPSIQHMTDTSAVDEFLSGGDTIAMNYLGNWMVNTIAASDAAKDVDVQMLPQGPAGRATTEAGISFGIYANTDHADASWKFLQFLWGPEAAEIRASMGIPTAYKPAISTWVSEFPQYNLDAYVQQAPAGKTYPVSENTAAWENAQAPVIADVWAGKTSPADGVKQLEDIINDALSKED